MDGLVQEGAILDDKYQVERRLGQGGMGVVVQALHLQLGQRFALKLLLPEACNVPEAVARFLREARAAAQIQSEHVVRVTDVGIASSGVPYMVMELLHGMDLAQLIRSRGGRLPIGEAVDYILQASEAIAAAHALGIVHRDLKPSNLFVTSTVEGLPHVKVLDFGISKVASDAGAGVPISMTTTSAIMGSPLYMSPEQIRSAKNVDARTDIWSLGVVLHELLSGAPVYQADTASALMAMIAADPPRRLRAVRPEAPAPLEKVILRCLEKDRDRRYGNVAELARALAAFGSSGGKTSADRASKILSARHAPSAGTIALPSHSAGSATAASWGQTSLAQAPRRGRALVMLALVGLATAIAGAGATVAAIHWPKGTPPPVASELDGTRPAALSHPTRLGTGSAAAGPGSTAPAMSVASAMSSVAAEPATAAQSTAADAGATPAKKAKTVSPSLLPSPSPRAPTPATESSAPPSVFDHRKF